MEGKKPRKIIAAGGIRAAIWENSIEKNGKQVQVPSVQIDRTYKQGEEWKRTSHFNVSDLPKLQLVAGKAFEFLSLKKQDNGDSETQ